MKWLRLAGLLVLVGCGSTDAPKPVTYLSRDELMDPVTCKKCHEQHYQEWSGSMHAYASDDPLFLAMNQRGQREAAIGPFCVKCHAPLAVATGSTQDGLNLADLPQKLKGIGCIVCHSVDAVEGTHDNPLRLADDGVMRGQFGDPVANPAHASAYSKLLDRDQLESAALCGSCHDIVNDHGAHIERTFAEWKEGVFAQPLVGTTCGQCHMDQSLEPAPAATGVPGVFSRTLHSHRFPGVDLALTDFPELEQQKSAVQTFLDTTIQSAVCVRGIGDGATLQVVLDNVAAGHHWPSGSAQDRRAWVEVRAYSAGALIYQSGAVPLGTAPTELVDPDFWLIRDCLLDSQGNETHMFWQASDYETNLLPGQLTFDKSDPRFYQTHVFQTYPRGASTLSTYPDRVTMSVHLQPFGLDVFDDLAASGDLADTDTFRIADLRERIITFALGAELEWTPDTGSVFVDKGLPVSCISTTNLNAAADKLPAVNHVRCSP